MMKQLIFGLSLALVSSAALAQDDGWFDDWDTDGDATITESEFNEGFGDAGLFDSWDEDDDDALADDEFSAGLFDSWDVDDDDALSEDEWNEVEEEGWFDI